MNVSKHVSSMWRYVNALALEHEASRVTMGEGWTPLVAAPVTARSIGCGALLVKDESQNPTGTFKDRSASYTVSRLKDRGVRGIVLNSTGNAAASFAVYSARADMRCVVIVPEDLLPENLLQARLAGAQIHTLADWSQASALSSEMARELDLVDVSTGKTTTRSQAKKTIGYEIAEQMGWVLPDVLVCPTGGGTAILAIQSAFQELIAAGKVIGTMPRLIISQYAGCAPLARAHAQGASGVLPWSTIDTPRGGMRTAAPGLGTQVLDAVARGGGAYAVDPNEASDAVGRMARNDGVIVGLETGTGLVAAAKAVSDTTVAANATVVVINTSTLLKSDPAHIQR
jgi:threonine synthase